MHYDMPLYRPPSEGNNLIIQVTLGCHFNQCSFCSMYKSKVYQARPLEAVFADIDQAASQWPDAQRVFLADGDALTLPYDHLMQILQYLAQRLPALKRVSCYANPSDILHKQADELAQLRTHKLTLLYVGIESGSALILKKITKGATPSSIARALIKAEAAQFKVSATVILGLGGQTHWQTHIDETVALLEQAPVTYLSTLQLYLEPDAEQGFLEKFKEPFLPQDDHAILQEQARLIAGLNPPRPIIFRSNHASNALALAGNLPRDRDKLLAQVHHCLQGNGLLRPHTFRRL